jgi:hypothetical protein
MEQDELNPSKLKHLSGCETKKMLEKKGIKEPKFERPIKAKQGTWFYTKERFVSKERDQELIEAFLQKHSNKVSVFTK